MMSSSLLATHFYTKLSAIGHTPVYFSIIFVRLWYTYVACTPGPNVPENAAIKRLKPSVRYMNSKHFMSHCIFYLWHRNRSLIIWYAKQLTCTVWPVELVNHKSCVLETRGLPVYTIAMQVTAIVIDYNLWNWNSYIKGQYVCQSYTIYSLFNPLIQYIKGCVWRFMHPHYLKAIANACRKLRSKLTETCIISY